MSASRSGWRSGRRWRRDTAAATAFAYAPGVHQSAVKAQRDGGWFSESWFARFAIEAAGGAGAGWRPPIVTAARAGG
ncbi:MAG TPA: hypothetical protein VGI17_02460 [Solirubrobacterales bacterium]